MTDRSPAAEPDRGRASALENPAVAGAGAVPAAEWAVRGAAAWVEALAALAALVAHDFRNTLNAVAVNLEVVRGRSARGAEAAAIAPFAATALAQFEVASAGVEGMLALCRAEAGPADVTNVADSVARVLAIRGDGTVRLTASGAEGALTSVPPSVVRALVARAVLSALGDGETATCEIDVRDGILVRVRGAASVPPSLDPQLAAVASLFAVGIATSGDTLELRLPYLHTDVTPHGPA